MIKKNTIIVVINLVVIAIIYYTANLQITSIDTKPVFAKITHQTQVINELKQEISAILDNVLLQDFDLSVEENKLININKMFGLNLKIKRWKSKNNGNEYTIKGDYNKVLMLVEILNYSTNQRFIAIAINQLLTKGNTAVLNLHIYGIYND